MHASRMTLIVGACALAACLACYAATVTVDENMKHQPIAGWGTCLVGWDLAATAYDDPAWRAAYRDVGCNILRVPMERGVLIHASGNNTIPIALGTNLQQNIDKFNFGLESVQMYGELAQWLAANALEPERVKIVGSVWSPPHWMKGPTGNKQYYTGQPSAGEYFTPWMSGDHSYGSPGTGSSIGGRLKQDSTNLAQFARYIAAWVQGFEQVFGVPLYAISLQNESTFENPFDSCSYITGEGDTNGAGTAGPSSQYWQYADALKAVKDEFERHGITTMIKGPHTARIGDSPSSPWMLNQNMKFIQAVKNHSDSNLIDFLSIYNCNGYLGSSEDDVKCWAAWWYGKQNVTATWASWGYAPGVQNDGKMTWASETGGEQPAWLNGAGGTPGSGAIVLAQKMHDALVHGHVSAYQHWQMTDHNALEDQHTLLGQSHISNSYDSKKYCVYKHFARYIRPGATRLEATFENGQTSIGGASEYDTHHGLNVSAYVHTQDLAYTFVLVNMQSDSHSVAINAPTGLPVNAYRVFRTSSSESLAEQPVLNVAAGTLALTMPGYSVVTLYGEVPEPLGGAAAVFALFIAARRKWSVNSKQ
jgi:O-glycosyl hydrolase